MFLLEESIRWLLTNGKDEKALLLLQKIASWNHFAVSDKTIEEVKKESNETKIQKKEEFTLKLLFSSPTLLKRYFKRKSKMFKLIYFSTTTILLPIQFQVKGSDFYYNLMRFFDSLGLQCALGGGLLQHLFTTD